MTGKKVAPCSGQAGTARDVPLAVATDTQILSNPVTQRQTGEPCHMPRNKEGRFLAARKSVHATHETADGYARVVARPCDGWRVIVCKDNVQWILQRRKKGGAERPWRAVGYFRTREALVRLCAASCWRMDPAAMAALTALPESFGGVA